MSEIADKAAVYGQLREKVALKGCWDSPEKLSDEDLAAFVQVEPNEHIVGHMYAGGCTVIDGVYAEIARRLVTRGRSSADDGLLARCAALADKAHASYVFARQGGGVKLAAELETAEDFLDVETILREFPTVSGFFETACRGLVGLVLLDHPAPWRQSLVNKEIGDTGEYDGFDQILDANGAVVLERPTDGLPDSEFVSLEDGDYLRLHRHIVGCVNAVASLRAAAREADGPVGWAERIEEGKNKEVK